MGTLTSVAICPHGFSIIEEIAGDELQIFENTRNAMVEAGELIMKDEPDIIVIASPHALKLKGYNAVYSSVNCKGSLEQNDVRVYSEYSIEQNMANALYNKMLEKNIPVISCNFGSMEGPFSNIPLDWGTFIPLWFCKPQKEYKIVVISPTRETSLKQMVEIGECVDEIVKKSDYKVAFIASADQGHCHIESGPYGYSKYSEIFDDKITEIVKENKLQKILDLDLKLIEAAKPDSIWQMLIMYGLIKEKGFKINMLSYEVPTYFGMLVAHFSK